MLEGTVGQARGRPEQGAQRIVDEVAHAGSLTTRARRDRPLLLVHTGDGKGKTTAAMGLALRAWARGWSVGVVQFVKSGTWPAGEKKALLALGRLHEATGEGGPVSWYQAGAGWSWSRPAAGGRGGEAARDGWTLTRTLLGEQHHDLLVLDELTHAIRAGRLDVGDVVATLAARPGHQHVVVTGRHCPPELAAVADLVTEMGKVRHPFDNGIRGQRGIEW